MRPARASGLDVSNGKRTRAPLGNSAEQRDVERSPRLGIPPIPPRDGRINFCKEPPGKYVPGPVYTVNVLPYARTHLRLSPAQPPDRGKAIARSDSCPAIRNRTPSRPPITFFFHVETNPPTAKQATRVRNVC